MRTLRNGKKEEGKSGIMEHMAKPIRLLSFPLRPEFVHPVLKKGQPGQGHMNGCVG